MLVGIQAAQCQPAAARNVEDRRTVGQVADHAEAVVEHADVSTPQREPERPGQPITFHSEVVDATADPVDDGPCAPDRVFVCHVSTIYRTCSLYCRSAPPLEGSFAPCIRSLKRGSTSASSAGGSLLR